jgi:hypothetical protein
VVQCVIIFCTRRFYFNDFIIVVPLHFKREEILVFEECAIQRTVPNIWELWPDVYDEAKLYKYAAILLQYLQEREVRWPISSS